MCLSLEALVLFLNLIGSDIVSTAGEAITVHATEGDVVWTASGEVWCADAGSQPRVYVADDEPL